MTMTKEQEVFRVAQDLYGQTPDWVTFFREVLGIKGVARDAFPGADDMARFEQTQEYAEIQHMVAKLRERGEAETDKEPMKVITVRLPASLHESLKVEASERSTSMNKLCISKLLQVIDGELVPSETAVS